MRFFIVRLLVIFFQSSDTKMGSNENSGPASVSQDIGGEMTTGRMFQGMLKVSQCVAWKVLRKKCIVF